jgi:tRNA pseudouridine55 synthase
MDKEYVAVVRLGRTTSTLDREGEVLSESEAWRELVPEMLENALAGLRGRLLQVPPEFSAKKLGGEPAHRRARRGETVELSPVEVTVHELELLGTDLPEARLRVVCSSGTYVRALARDWGEALGVGAHLTELRRVRVGAFHVRDAAPPEALDDAGELLRRIIEPSRALAHLPAVSLSEDEAARLAHGQEVATPGAGLSLAGPVAVLRRGALVAVASSVDGRLRPRKVFSGWEP